MGNSFCTLCTRDDQEVVVEFDTLRSTLEDRNEQLEQLEQKLSEVQEINKQSKASYASLEQENKDIKEKHAELLKCVQELEREKEELKEKLAQSQEVHIVIESEQKERVQQCEKEKQEQQKLVTQLSVQNEEQTDHISRLERELHEKSDQLVLEQESIKEERSKLLSMTAASHQARKLYGDTRPGDITHAHVADKYLEFFKYYLRNLPRQNPSVDRLVVQQALAKLFQSIYECGCKVVLNLLQSELGDMLVLQPSEGDLEAQEREHDIAYAFSLLVYHIKERKGCIEHLKSKISEGIQEALPTDIVMSDELLDKAVDIVVNMLTLTPPQLVDMPKDFNEELHEIRSNNWTDCEDDSYDLIYFRPILYLGRNGEVATPGLVGNKLTHSTE